MTKSRKARIIKEIRIALKQYLEPCVAIKTKEAQEAVCVEAANNADIAPWEMDHYIQIFKEVLKEITE